MPRLQVGELALLRIDREHGEAVPIKVGRAQLRSRMWALLRTIPAMKIASDVTIILYVPGGFSIANRRIDRGDYVRPDPEPRT